ncbi:MAG: LytTR family DNA-binding domain-containing protein [Angelakisella sp.]
MKIIIHENPTLEDTEIVINCKKADEAILHMLSLLHSLDSKLTGTKNGDIFLLRPEEILYIDTVDKKTFFYTETDVYETPLRLYELEEQLGSGSFFRSSKSSIVNIAAIKSIRPELGGRLTIVLCGGEKLIVSRQYSAVLKEKLGLR